MISQEQRVELINNLMSKLLKTMTGIQDDKSLSRYEQMALNILRKHRGISINRNEVRRKIDDMKEKFVVDNLKEYAEQLELFSNAVITNPLCLKHYEVDIQWSLIDFLIEIAYNPTVAIRKNPPKFVFEIADLSAEDYSAELEEYEIKELLKEDFIPVPNYKDEGSDLSDWSDDEENEANIVAETTTPASSCQHLIAFKPVRLLPHLPPLKPPVREVPFALKTASSSIKQEIEEKIQSSCWVTDTLQVIETSSHILHDAANFAILLSKCSTIEAPAIVTDFCFLRELLWMFYAPQDCQTFEINAGQQIRVRSGVTLSSVSAPTLAAFLESQILPYANEMIELQDFFNKVQAFQNHRLPRTYDFYAANLKSLLDPIILKIVNFEDRVVAQHNFELNTLIGFHNTFRETFKHIEILYTIHKEVSLDYENLPSHIVSSYLLAALLRFCNSTSNSIEANRMAAALFLTSINAYCGIIDSWWNEGRLDDWQEEFAVEYDGEQKISQRNFDTRYKDKAFYVPKYVSDVICESKFVSLLLMHSLEVGHTLNLLYEISRIGDLRDNCKDIKTNIYDAFIEDVLNQFHRRGVKSETTTNGDIVDFKHTQLGSKNKKSKGDDIHLATNDEFLLLLFGNLNKDEIDMIDTAKTTKDKNAFEVFEELSQYQHLLPYEEIILNSFTKILRERIALANMFVVKLYREDFKILTHLRNLRKVLLLEADDLMLQFYGKLFKEIEAGKPWANAFGLTMQMDDILSSKFPEMSTLFRFEINVENCIDTKKVMHAIESLTVNYNLSNELVKIITDDDMRIYNKIFRFLLQIKWGLMMLENMPFVRAKRPHYASLDIIQFAMRRLENIRFWIIISIRWIASHLLMLQVMGDELDFQLEQCRTLNEMKAAHKSYLATMSEHCFLTDNLKGISIGIEQLLSLVLVLQSDHKACSKQLNQCDPLSLADDSAEIEELENESYSFTAHIDELELTYIRCHEYLANLLKNEVYIKQRTFLSGLCAAFNTSMPY